MIHGRLQNLDVGLEAFVAATTLGNKLIEYQLLCFGSFQSKAFVFQGVLTHFAGYFGFPTYPMYKHGSPCTNSVKQTKF